MCTLCVTICRTGCHAGSITSARRGRMDMRFVLSMSHRPGIHGHAFTAYVGNGGFSLRRIAACRQLLAEFAEEAAWFREHGWGEDLFFGLFGQLSERFVLPTCGGCRVCLGNRIAAHACPVSGPVADGDPRPSQVRP